MKKYIFLTRPLANAGGVQCYVSAKALCLEKKGWNVNVIYYDFKRRNYSLYSSLEKFVKCNVVGLGICPYMFPKVVVERLLQKIVTCVGNVVDYDEIIIESHDAPTSQWGELLANKIKARHFFYTMEESYRGKNVFYEPQIDFYLFKFDRKEILGTSTAFNRLFDEYRIITKKDYPGDLLIAEAPIQDIPCSMVEEIKRRYWNICYIGRGDKPYVPNVIKEIGNFACQHKDKSIQFITVGDMKEHESLINEITRKNKNLTILELGIMLQY